MNKTHNILIGIATLLFIYFGYQIVYSLSLVTKSLSLLNPELIDAKTLGEQILIYFSIVCFSFIIIVGVLLFKIKYKGKNNSKDNSSTSTLSDKSNKNKEEYMEDVFLSKNKSELLEIASEIKNINKENSENIIKHIGKFYEACMGIIYLVKGTENIEAEASFAYLINEENKTLKITEGLIGQAIKNKKPMFFNHIPKAYIEVISGLGSSEPKALIILPVFEKNKLKAVLEIALFKKIEEKEHIATNFLLEQITIEQ